MKLFRYANKLGNLRGACITASILFISVAFNNLHAQEVYAPGGKAISGYDPVAFFSENKPVAGNEKYTLRWNDATWYFASSGNLNTFKNSPEKYAPQFGGYCAYGTAQGHKAPTKPETWTVAEGKLYFNYSLGVKKSWDKNRDSLIKKANENWPTVRQETFH